MAEPTPRPRGRPRKTGPKLTGADVAQFSLRIPRELHARLVALAESERRSLNEQIVVMLERATAKRARAKG